MMENIYNSKNFKKNSFFEIIIIICFVYVETNPKLRDSPILITIVKIWKNVKWEII